MKIGKLLLIADRQEDHPAAVSRLEFLQRLGLEEVLVLRCSKGEKKEIGAGDCRLACREISIQGSILPGVLRAVAGEGIGLIATGSVSGAKGIFRRSYVERLLSATPVPYLMLNGESGEAAASENPFHHVVFPTDWSPASESAMRYLLNMTEMIDMLEILYVMNKGLSVRELRNLKNRLAQTRKAFLDEGVDAEVHVYAGSPREEILLAARDYSATSIIMGASCGSFLKRLFSKGCSYRLAEEAKMPILFVPSADPRAPGKGGPQRKRIWK